ncbi:SirB2 family protein [Piscinibacterium candidicorallinum]|uniref:SirB2 family protein n=1 Tax=Piscinibacterium candidicorallinum TaxID=1793872 RepID=A0ABV7HBM1_9BURK
MHADLLAVHRACVALSLTLFTARGLGVAVNQSWPMHSALCHLSAVTDTLLLLAGASLWWLIGYSLAHNTWLSAKLTLLPIYIVLGSFALKRGRTHAQRMTCLVGALAVVFYVLGIAIYRQPWSWFAFLFV